MKLTKKQKITIAMFCIYLVVSMSAVFALSISTPVVTPVANAATVTWNTDEAANGSVNYGTTRNLGLTRTAPLTTQNHSIVLPGLSSNTLYFYEVVSSNATTEFKNNNGGNFYNFTTLSNDTTPPAIHAGVPQYVNVNRVSFTGTTEPRSLVRVYVNRPQSDIGTINYDGIATADDTGLFTFVNLQLTQELNEIIIWSRDAAGNTNTSRYITIIDSKPPEVKLIKIQGNEAKFQALPTTSMEAALDIEGTVDEPVNITYTVDVPDNLNVTSSTETLNADGVFTLSVPLTPDEYNRVEIIFEDKGGNIVRFKEIILVDTKDPSIIWDNIDALNPSYIADVTIRGQVSEPGATVIIFVNEQTISAAGFSTSLRDTLVKYGSIAAEIVSGQSLDYTAIADENGEFAIPIYLSQAVVVNQSRYIAPVKGSKGSATNMFEKEDTINLQQQKGNLDALGTTVDLGAAITQAFDNKVRILVIDKVGRTNDPEVKIITFARCGYGGDWKVDIGKMSPGVITPELMSRGMASISFPVTLKWQGPGDPNKAILLDRPDVRPIELSQEVRENYYFDPNELVGASNIQDSWDDAGYKYGNVIVKLNKKELTLEEQQKMAPSDFMVRIPLLLELNYQYESFGKKFTSVQRQCWDVTTAIDVRVPPDTVPRDLLLFSIGFINSTIAAIDVILEPLQTLILVTFVTCLLSWILYFAKKIQTRYQCRGDNIKNPTTDECKRAVQSDREVKAKLQLVCDRIFCPPAPTAEAFMLQHRGSGDVCAGLSADRVGMLEGKSTFFPIKAGDLTKLGGEEKCGQAYLNEYDSVCLGMDELLDSQCLAVYEAERQGRQPPALRAKAEQKCANPLRKGIYGVSNFCSSREKGNYLIRKKDAFGNEKVYEYEDGKVYEVDIRDEAGCEITDKNTGKCVDWGSWKAKVDNRKEVSEEKMRELGFAYLLDKEFVVDPTSGLIRSIQCVCLPAINGYLILWKNVLTTVKACFQTILITGDGSSGTCRAVLTTYICDLVFAAIRCLMKRFGGSSNLDQSRQTDRGIGDFLKITAGAAEDVREDVSGRYGKTNLFKNLFVEKQLIHAICLWAFTGEFDLDLESMLTGAGAIPLKSEGFLYPTTRRFLGSNPLTGRATFVYHIGAGLIAGADINYRLRLVCSPKNDCDPAEFISGQCDCFQKREEVNYDITREFGGGFLPAGELIGPDIGDIYVEIPEADVRFDRAVLEWEYTDNNGQRVQDKIESYISQVGGSPPLGCKFDLGSLEFRCQLVIGGRGFARFVETPALLGDANGNGVIDPGETIKYNLKVEKKSPDFDVQSNDPKLRNPEKQIPFYLKYSLRNQIGALLPLGELLVSEQLASSIVQGGAPSSSYEKLIVINTDNPPFSRGDLPGFQLPTGTERERLFTATTSQLASGILPLTFDNVDLRKVPKTNIIGVDTRTVICKYTDKEYNTIDKALILSKGTGAFEFIAEPVVLEGENPVEVKSTKERCSFNDNETKVTCFGGRIIIPITQQYLSNTQNPPKHGDEIGIKCVRRIPESPAGGISTTTCNDITRNNPSRWTFKVGLYYAKQRDLKQSLSLANSEPSDEVVVYQGQPQELSITVPVVCSDEGKVDPKDIELCPVNVLIEDKEFNNLCACESAKLISGNLSCSGGTCKLDCGGPTAQAYCNVQEGTAKCLYAASTCQPDGIVNDNPCDCDGSRVLENEGKECIGKICARATGDRPTAECIDPPAADPLQGALGPR